MERMRRFENAKIENSAMKSKKANKANSAKKQSLQMLLIVQRNQKK